MGCGRHFLFAGMFPVKPQPGLPCVLRIIFYATLFIFLSREPVQAEKVTLNFWAVSGSFMDVEMFNRLAKDFEAKSGIAVRVTPLGWGNFNTKYLTAMAAGVPPDVGITNLGAPVDYGKVGGVIDLLEAFPEEMAIEKERFYPNLLDGFTFRGHLFGLPASLTTLALFYRTDIFHKLGIKPPETWSELDEAIRMLEAAGYRYGFGWTRGDGWALDIYSQPYGISSLDYNQQGDPVVNWLNPVFQSAVSRAIRLWYLHDLGDRNLQGARHVALFKLDQPGNALPLMIDLSFIYNVIPLLAPELEGKWDILPWPRADDGVPYNIVGGTAYVIFRKSKYHKESFEWLKYLNSLEAQQSMVLDHNRRGEDSTFFVSGIKTMWASENASFWQRPELKNCERIHEIMAGVMDSLHLKQPVLGGGEAGGLIDPSLDRMGASALNELSHLASAHRMTRWEMIQAFARGEFSEDHKKLIEKTDQVVREQLAKIAAPAQAILDREDANYDRQYGDILNRLPMIEQQKDFLFWMELLAGIILLLAIMTVCLYPGFRKNRVSYLFIAPPLVSTLIFLVIPASVAVYLSLTDYMPVLPLATAPWVGWSHYLSVIMDGSIIKSLQKTLFYVAGMLPIQILISLILACLLNNPLCGQRYWRFLFFAPMVTSVVSISLIFFALFQGARYGWINALFLKLGLIDDVITFLDDGKTFLPCVIALAIWHGLAFNIIVFLAGLQQIPEQLYEAAEVDGAGWFQRFRHISFPGLQPQIFFTLVVGMIWAFQVFEPIYMLGGGAGEAGTKFGPDDAGLTLVPLVYQTGFEYFKMGKASAIAYILFAFIFVLTLFQVKTLKRERS